jgi:CRISPR-associated endonuclease/helicase Cas3
MEELAKPTGISYNAHADNVITEGRDVVHSHPFVIKKYAKFTNTDLSKRLEVAAKYHDEGKKHTVWQAACRSDYETYLHTGVVGKNLLTTGMRHEIESLKLKTGFSNVVKVAIAAHHGKLSERFSHRWQDNLKSKELWNSFKKISNELRLTDFEKAILQNYEFAGCRSYLQLVDHRASAKEEKKEVPTFTPFSYSFNKDWTRRNVQKIAEDNWQDKLLLMRAPTGAGKTDACLLWAKKQIENNRADRLVIAMPTRFTSNALAINVESSLSETGLYHSSAWFTKYYSKASESKKTLDYQRLQHEFARHLETPITICTIDHLLISLTHTKEEHHSVTFNLAHSCVVIDEADFYDEFTQANILELLKVLFILDVPVLIMSASLPESSLKMYQTTGYSPKEIKEDKSDYDRIRCNILNKTEYEELDELEGILEQALSQPTIIYANTVAKAMSLYNWYQEKGIEPILYHSRFTEPDKVKKENLLIKSLGKKAWQGNKATGIAIMTQIGEMSVNISSNYMISEICPMDRLVQRVGRLARFDQTIGNLDVLIPQKKGSLYPAPYGSYHKGKGWQPILPMTETLRLLECKGYNAGEFVGLINLIYPEMVEFSPETQNNIDNYRKSIVYNWLITPQEKLEEDDNSSNFWKSRNIGNQSEVFTVNPESINDCYFDSYNDFNLFKNQCALSCPNYILNNAIKEGLIYKQPIIIRDDKKEISIAQHYSKKIGLILTDDCFL